MIALVTPQPVYWLLDAIQALGVLGIVGGLWLIATRRRRPVSRPIKITLTADATQYLAQMRRARAAVRRSQRGAGRLEFLLAWVLIIGGCAAAWAWFLMAVFR